MGIWRWLGLEGSGDCEDIAPVPQFEQLKPRLLLSSDLIGLEITPDVTDSLREPVVSVDLSPEISSADYGDNNTVLSLFLPQENVSGGETAEDEIGEDSALGAVQAEASCLAAVEASTQETPSQEEVERSAPAVVMGEQSLIVEQLVETLRSANGPPVNSIDQPLIFQASAGQNDLSLRFTSGGIPGVELWDNLRLSSTDGTALERQDSAVKHLQERAGVGPGW